MEVMWVLDVDEPVIHMPMFNAVCCVLLTWWIVWMLDGAVLL